MDNPTDFAALLIRLQAAEITALNEVYHLMRDRLYAYALSIVKDEFAAQDLVQELFIDFWENRLYQHIRTGLVPYLMQAIRNRSLDYVKRERNRDKLRKAYFGDAEPYAADAMEAKALGEAIEAAIERLPPVAAQVFRLHYLEQLSYAEIAEKLDISPHTVSSHMTKALKRLREQLKKFQ